MKRSWQPEELIEHWTLIPTELDLLTKKTATNRLGIALLLKYFQYEGRFPTAKADINAFFLWQPLSANAAFLT